MIAATIADVLHLPSLWIIARKCGRNCGHDATAETIKTVMLQPQLWLGTLF